MDGELPFSMMDVIVLLNLPYPPSGRASYNINCPCCDTHNKKHLNINLVKNAFCCPKCGFSGGMLDLYGFYAKMDRSKAYRAILEMPLHIGLSRKAISVQSALVHPYACQSSPSTSG